MVGVFGMVEKNESGFVSELSELNAKLTEEDRRSDSDNIVDCNLKSKNNSEVVLFFSYDIVNSTEYKSINYYGWAKVINNLFKCIRKRVDEEISSAEMWRVLGDEVIFIVRVYQEETLHEYVNKIFKIMVNTVFQIKNGELFESRDEELHKLQNILSLKAAAWIAIVNDVGNVNNNSILLDENDNIFEQYQPVAEQPGYSLYEFLGNDIDAGFRISKQTMDGRFVISYELAYLISKETDSLACLNIITYRRLKGIWKNRLYPVIWYHDPKAYIENYQKEIIFNDSFPYDAYDENDLMKEYFNNTQGENEIIRDQRMFSDPNYAIQKIKTDRGLARKLERIKSVISNSTHSRTKYVDPESMQIHCAAVCYKIEDDQIKILVFKRSEDRKRFPGMWEFGCSKAQIDKTISDRLKEEYKADFDISIDPVCDTNRSSPEPIPIALYQVNQDSASVQNVKTDKGIIVLAEIVGDFDVDNFTKTEKHEEARWICESDLERIQTEFSNAVPDFEATIRRAIVIIRSFDNEVECRKDNS